MTLQEKQNEINIMSKMIQSFNSQNLQLIQQNNKLSELLENAVRVAEKSQNTCTESLKVSQEYKELSARILKSYSNAIEEIESLRKGGR